MLSQFHPEALEEYEDAVAWYAQRELQIAQQFVGSVEEAISRVLTAPSSYPVIEDDIRRCLTHVFPYAILYTIEEDHLLIVAIMHYSREPNYWKRRL
jgi:toxin ParE1/3/4